MAGQPVRLALHRHPELIRRGDRISRFDHLQNAPSIRQRGWPQESLVMDNFDAGLASETSRRRFLSHAALGTAAGA
jgi:hypothetical protein